MNVIFECWKISVIVVLHIGLIHILCFSEHATNPIWLIKIWWSHLKENCFVSIVLPSDLCRQIHTIFASSEEKTLNCVCIVQLWHLLWYLLDCEARHSSVWWHLRPAKKGKKGRFRGLAKQPNLNRSLLVLPPDEYLTKNEETNLCIGLVHSKLYAVAD